MGIFKGIRTKNGVFVTYDDVPLELRLDLKNHFPMGFEWGYSGSGPRQLALAILTKFISDELALEYYDEFCKDFIQPTRKKEWDLDDFLVREWLLHHNVIYGITQLKSRFKVLNKYMYLDDVKIGSIDLEKESNRSIVYCDFSDIFHLSIEEIPENILFYFAESDPEKYRITKNLELESVSQLNGGLVINYWFNIDVVKYLEENGINPLSIMKNFLLELNSNNFELTSNIIDNGIHFLDFYFYEKEINSEIQNTVKRRTNILLDLYGEVVNSFKNDIVFQAVFNFPKEYQSVLKAYILYFEEFLNDLCIDTDVEIKKEGDDTILSVIPKNKDEALEKIADALKVYISAPILANNVSFEEKMQMQVSLQKLHAQCSHLESQLLYKNIMLVEQKNIVDETKSMLIRNGFDEEKINENTMMLINSLKSVNYNQQTKDAKTYFKSMKASFKLLGIFDANIEVKKSELGKRKTK